MTRELFLKADTMKRGAGLLLPFLLLGACTVGPDYKQPDVAPPTAFRDQPTGLTEARSFAEMPWQNVFSDKALQALIVESLANNNNLQVAVSRIEQARAAVSVVKSQGLPQVGYQASAEGGRISEGPVSKDAVTFGNFVGLIGAAWELDIWGRIRHATDAARANLLAQEDIRRGVILTLVSDIAANYFRLIALDRELEIAQESAKVYKSTLDLFTLRYESGRDSRLPVERAQSAYESANAAVHDLTREIGQLENAISTLVGAYPKGIPRGDLLKDQTTPETPLGSTTALLQRRPDILHAEQKMIGANAEIGVAVADFFPRIGLSTFVGGQGVSVASAFTGFGVWNTALSLAGPILSSGRLEGVYQQRKAFWDETVAQYKQTVLTAFHETSDALVAQRTLVSREKALQGQVQALRQSVDIAMERYRAGRASYFEILEAQQQLFPAEAALAQTERDRLLAVVNLYKALGGGWSPDEPATQTAGMMQVSDPAGGGQP